MTPSLLLLPLDLLEHIGLALVCPSQPAPGSPLSSTRLRDLAALAATSRECHAFANPLLHTAAIAFDLIASQLVHRQEAFLRRYPLRLYRAVEAYRDPWLSVSASGQPSYNREPLLLWAVTSGRLDILHRLLQHAPESLVYFLLGVRLAVCWPCLDQHQPHLPPEGATETYYAAPLHAAARAGHDDLVKYILDRGGVNINIDAEAQLLCLCPSSRINRPDELCATPLHVALSHGHHSTAKILMLRGAIWDRPFEFSRGVTGLHIMAATGAADLANWIADSDWPGTVLKRNWPLHDWPDIGGFYCLHYACLSPGVVDEVCSSQPSGTQSSRLVSSLTRLGAVVNTKDEKRAAQRLEMEIHRLGPLINRLWVDPNRCESDWAYFIKFWERDMKYYEFAPEEPEALVTNLDLRAMALAIRRSQNDPGAGAIAVYPS
ncbi:hypothetical protein CSUB01_11804 [Colletotrichum sublineola]|uniref:Uncharacterized protein n=1 Tax=Colletotrichum sublineola TaxID=1173701 RepID=A0A066XD46_COLSU|nr:hypothetical protein CSUB01_11804 [Colletotrichum sublineola]